MTTWKLPPIGTRATLAFKLLALSLMLSDHVHFVFFHRQLKHCHNVALENPVFNPKDAL